MRSALQKWDELVAYVNGRILFGMDGVRDPEHPCEAFVLGKPDRGSCETDGHYMCDECVHRDSCERCGYRSVSCDCDSIAKSLVRFFEFLNPESVVRIKAKERAEALALRKYWDSRRGYY